FSRPAGLEERRASKTRPPPLLAALQVEQELLPPKPAAAAAELAALVYDAGAGGHNRDAGRAIGPARRPRCLGLTNGNGDVLVRTRFAKRDLQQLAPHTSLEVGAWINERNRKLAQRASEVTVQFALECVKVLVRSGRYGHPEYLAHGGELRI